MQILLYHCVVESSFPGTTNNANLRPPRSGRSPDRVGVFQFTKLGDVYTSLPLVRKIRQKYNRSQLLFFTDEKYATALDPVPEIDQVVTFPVRRWQKEIQAGTLEIQRVEEWLRNIPQPEMIFNCHDSLRSAVLTELLGPDVYAGLRYDRGEGLRVYGTLFSLWKIYMPYVVETNGINPYETPDILTVPQQLLLRFGFGPRNSYRLPAPRTEPPTEINDSGRNLGLILAGGWPTKRWPRRHLASFLDELAGSETDIYLLGGKDVTEAGQQLSTGREEVTNLTGQTSLAETAAVLEEMDLVISNDTGPLHLAGWLGCPVITLCGPTRIGAVGPGPGLILQGAVDCAGCQKNECKHDSLRCLEQVQPQLLVELEKRLRQGTSLSAAGRELAPEFDQVKFFLRESKTPYSYHQHSRTYSDRQEIQGVLYNWLATYLVSRLNETFHPPSGKLAGPSLVKSWHQQTETVPKKLEQQLQRLSESRRELEEKWQNNRDKVDWSEELPLGPYLAGLGMVAAGRRSKRQKTIRKYQAKALELIEEFIEMIKNN